MQALLTIDTREPSRARVASSAGGQAAGASLILRNRIRVSHRGSSPNKLCCLSRGATKGMRRVSSPTDLWLDPVISRRTRSSDLSIVVDLFMYVWCACVELVCMYMSRYYSCIQMRGKKNKKFTNLKRILGGTEAVRARQAAVVC